jgi:transposase InsO family protein
MSERRVCRVLGQWRSTQRYAVREPERDRRLVRRMLEMVQRRPRFGYRRIAILLRREEEFGGVNVKRVYRLWREAGLRVPRKQRKRRRLGTSAHGVLRHRAEHKDHVWCYDFVKDQTEDGRALKFLPIEDEYTRECLALEVARSIQSEDVMEVLRYLLEVRGAPQYIRSDNGPEFIARAIRQWLKESGVRTLYIEPGAPWENAYSESFIGRFRDEVLDRELFTSVAEAKLVSEDYRLDYNQRRPHSSLNYATPAEFAARSSRPGSAGASGGPTTLRPAAHTVMTLT